MNDSEKFKALFHLHHHKIQPVVPPGFCVNLNLSVENPDLEALLKCPGQGFEKYLHQQFSSNNVDYLVGGYLENRSIYKKYDLFQKGQPRSIHLGVDIWASADTPVFAPLDAAIHSFASNNSPGDYGTTLVLKHQFETVEFYTLYGHLRAFEIKSWEPGKIVKAGEYVARVGDYPENGNWPPHLHFQIILDMQQNYGDFPGVCNRNEMTEFERNCPDPMLLLQKIIKK